MPAILRAQSLREHVEAGWDSLAVDRELRAEAYQEVMGRFTRRTDGERRPLNMIARGLKTLTAHLAAFNPEHDVQTDNLQLRGEAALVSLYLDRLADKLRRKRLTRLCLQDAFLGPKAIVRHGIKAGSDLVRINGRSYDPGQPYLWRVPFDDWLCDPAARSWEELQWEGNYYRVPRVLLLECGLYNPAVIERLAGLKDGGGAERQGGARLVEELGISTSMDRRFGLSDQVEMLDVVIYDENGEGVVVTMPAQDGFDTDFLRVESYEGPGRGPYEWMEFHPLNEHVNGIPPVADWRESAEAFNRIVTKMVEDIEETKRVLAVDEDSPDDDVETITEARNGAVVRVRNVQGMMMVEYGGTSQGYGDALGLIQNWSNLSQGNTDILSGGGADTDKATIYSGLQANANVLVQDYAGTHEEFENKLSEANGFWALNDPFIKLPLTYRMPGGEYIQLHFDAATRKGDFGQFQFKIRPRSMQSRDPNVQAANLLELLNIVLEAAQASQLSGGLVNVAGVARVGGRRLGIDEIQEVVNDQLLIAQQQQISAMMPQQSQGQPVGGVPGLNPRAMQQRFQIQPGGGGGGGARGGAGRGAQGGGGGGGGGMGRRTQPVSPIGAIRGAMTRGVRRSA